MKNRHKTPWLKRTAAVLSVLGVLGVAGCGFPYDDDELRDINDAFSDTLQPEETSTESPTEAATETNTETETQTTSAPSNSSQSITVDGKKRTYSVTVPPEARRDPAPADFRLSRQGRNLGCTERLFKPGPRSRVRGLHGWD
ncbi:hypothetical protein [Corynebacterium pilosum]|uniref:hypothetical protein n=1 Tax=Corynebacterium pilosum TaxID=35756 RepID=UPI000652B22D|nr:hypothetical protein [Corynebacterium pilosum]